MKVDLKYLGIGGAILTGLYFFVNDLVENAAMRKKVNLSLSDLRNGVSDKITDSMISKTVQTAVENETAKILAGIHSEVVEKESYKALKACADEAVEKCSPTVAERIAGQVDEQIRKIDNVYLTNQICEMALKKSSDKFDHILNNYATAMGNRMDDMYKTLEKTAKSEIQNRIRNGIGIGSDILSIRLTK